MDQPTGGGGQEEEAGEGEDRGQIITSRLLCLRHRSTRAKHMTGKSGSGQGGSVREREGGVC